METRYKQPISVLVVIHTAALDVLLLERARQPGFWQSVTGSREDEEALLEVARRETREETGIDLPASAFCDWRLSNRFEIFPQWRHRYAPGITHNLEHVFSVQIAADYPIRIAPDEHSAWQWRSWREAAELCFSWSNRDAILMLPQRIAS
jgi:dihydroneopterin triphosphate diphosphatase